MIESAQLGARPETQPRAQTSRRTTRRVGLALAAATLLAVSACGFDAQTLLPYTPAAGVGVNVGNGSNGQPVASTVLVRNLMLLSSEPGQAFVSGSMWTEESDALTGITGYAIKSNGSQGSAISATISDPIQVSNSQLVVLTDQPRITLTSEDLAPGLSASLTLTFSKAGSQQVIVPIGDANVPPYSEITPVPSSSPSPTS